MGKKKRKVTKKFLDEQLDFLEEFCDLYDSGKIHYAKKIASTLRILLHDTSKSTSLLKQLKKKNVKFVNSAQEIWKDTTNSLSVLSLISIPFGGSTGDRVEYFIPLDEVSHYFSYSYFDDWWNEVVIIDKNNNKFSRKDLILETANTDGGAHIDPGLREDYYGLVEERTADTWEAEINGKIFKFSDSHLASIRQIGHEILKTFKKGYSKYPSLRPEFTIGNLKPIFVDEDKSELIKTERKIKDK